MSTLRIAAIQWQFHSYTNSADWWQALEWQIRIARDDYFAVLVIFPDYLFADHPGAWPPHAAVCAALGKFSARYQVWIIGGSLPFVAENGLRNRCWISGPAGELHHQDKIHITPWERETWGMVGGDDLQVLDILGTKVAVAICYDVEFPEQVRAMADRGVEILCVPYCTDDAHGHCRVTRCAQARAIENTLYVVAAGCVGSLQHRPGFGHHYAASLIATPCDVGFPPAGIAAQAEPLQPQCIVASIDLALLRAARDHGTVSPRADLRRDLFR
jgi:predicted amidohydrolase